MQKICIGNFFLCALIFKVQKKHIMTNSIFSILTKYAAALYHKAGLFLLDLPTGFGKTFVSLAFMYQQYCQTQRRIVFLTDLKKNLPTDDFKKRFFEDNLPAYERDVLTLKAYSDHWTELVDKQPQILATIPDNIQSEASFKELQKSIKMYLDFDKNAGKSKGEAAIKSMLKENIRQSERIFRQSLRKIIATWGDTPEIRLHKIKKNHAWLIDLYPSVLALEKRVLFMSVDKFLLPIDPIYDTPFFLFEEDHLKETLIIIDEFDASKEVLVKRTIDNNLQNRVDIVSLFNALHAALITRQLPTKVTQNSKVRQDRQARRQKEYAGLLNQTPLSAEETIHLTSLKEKIDSYKDMGQLVENMLAELKKIEEKVKIAFTLKVVNPHTDRRFLFHDWRYHTIVKDENAQYIALLQNDEKQVNEIHFLREAPTRKRPTLLEFMHLIDAFIATFSRHAQILANNFRDNHLETPQNDDAPEFSEYLALKSVLSGLEIPDAFHAYLHERVDVYKSNFTRKTNKTPAESSPSFYDTGYRYYAFEDNDMHALQSKIKIATFDQTPESQLATWAEHAMIVGVSATARLDTVVGNYNLDYFVGRLGTNFRKISATKKGLLLRR